MQNKVEWLEMLKKRLECVGFETTNSTPWIVWDLLPDDSADHRIIQLHPEAVARIVSPDVVAEVIIDTQDHSSLTLDRTVAAWEEMREEWLEEKPECTSVRIQSAGLYRTERRTTSYHLRCAVALV